MRADRLAALLSAMVLLAVAPAAAGQKAQKAQKTPADSYEALLARYLDDARKTPSPSGATDWGWMNGLTSDRRARQANDLVTVRVVESISASGTADSALAKNSSTGVGVTSLFGIEHAIPTPVDPTSLVGAKSDTQFKGSGSTNRAGELSAVMSARVAEVLPNGYLVLEGIREIEINGERQVVVLTGIIRPADVDARNVVRSTAIAQMRIRYFGRGLFKDNLQPGWLIRMLNKVF